MDKELRKFEIQGAEAIIERLLIRFEWSITELEIINKTLEEFRLDKL